MLIIVLSSLNIFAQNNASILGIWKGTSICQVKNSPCHDENVVYHISKTDSLNWFRLVANKIINKQEEEMGTLLFEYDPQKQTLTSTDTTRNAQWIFKLEGKRIKGTLIYKNNLFRVIDVTKEN